MSEAKPTKTEDEDAIRELVERWMSANLASDHATLLELLDDDVVFLTSDRPPFGKEAFAQPPPAGQSVQGGSTIRELEVFGDHAHLSCHVDITVAQLGDLPQRYAGLTQTVLRRGADGEWRIWRDANFVQPAPG